MKSVAISLFSLTLAARPFSGQLNTKFIGWIAAVFWLVFIAVPLVLVTEQTLNTATWPAGVFYVT